MTIAEMEQLIQVVTALLCHRLRNTESGIAKSMEDWQENAAVTVTMLTCTELCEIANLTPRSEKACAIVKALRERRTVSVRQTEFDGHRRPHDMPYTLWRTCKTAYETCRSYGIVFESETKRQSEHRIGVPPLKSSKRDVITLAKAERLFAEGKDIPLQAVITPLAYDYIRQRKYK